MRLVRFVDKEIGRFEFPARARDAAFGVDDNRPCAERAVGDSGKPARIAVVA